MRVLVGIGAMMVCAALASTTLAENPDGPIGSSWVEPTFQFVTVGGKGSDDYTLGGGAQVGRVLTDRSTLLIGFHVDRMVERRGIDDLTLIEIGLGFRFHFGY